MERAAAQIAAQNDCTKIARTALGLPEARAYCSLDYKTLAVVSVGIISGDGGEYDDPAQYWASDGEEYGGKIPGVSALMDALRRRFPSVGDVAVTVY